MTSFKTLAISVVACGALLATLPSGALAAKRHATKPAHTTKPKATKTQKSLPANSVRIAGTVKSFANGVLTVQLKNNTSVDVSVNGSTVYYVNGAKAAAAPVFTSSERVEVIAQKQSNGSYVALRIAVGHEAKRAHAGASIAGTVDSSTSTSLKILLANNTTVTVQLNGQTKYVVNGAIAAARPTLTKGEAVRVKAQKQTNGSLLARVVATGTFAKPAHDGVRIAGAVTNASTNGSVTTLTIKLKNGNSVTVTVNSSTRFVVNGKQAMAAPTLASNQQVRILAQKQADGSYLALVVSVRTS